MEAAIRQDEHGQGAEETTLRPEDDDDATRDKNRADPQHPSEQGEATRGNKVGTNPESVEKDPAGTDSQPLHDLDNESQQHAAENHEPSRDGDLGGPVDDTDAHTEEGPLKTSASTASDGQRNAETGASNEVHLNVVSTPNPTTQALVEAENLGVGQDGHPPQNAQQDQDQNQQPLLQTQNAISPQQAVPGTTNAQNVLPNASEGETAVATPYATQTASSITTNPQTPEGSTVPGVAAQPVQSAQPIQQSTTPPKQAPEYVTSVKIGQGSSPTVPPTPKASLQPTLPPSLATGAPEPPSTLPGLNAPSSPVAETPQQPAMPSHPQENAVPAPPPSLTEPVFTNPPSLAEPDPQAVPHPVMPNVDTPGAGGSVDPVGTSTPLAPSPQEQVPTVISPTVSSQPLPSSSDNSKAPEPLNPNTPWETNPGGDNSGISNPPLYPTIPGGAVHPPSFSVSYPPVDAPSPTTMVPPTIVQTIQQIAQTAAALTLAPTASNDIGEGVVVISNNTGKGTATQTLAIDASKSNLQHSHAFEPPEGWTSIGLVCVFCALVFFPVALVTAVSFYRKAVQHHATFPARLRAGLELAGSQIRAAFLNMVRLRHCRGEDLENLGSEAALYLALHRETVVLVTMMSVIGCSILLPLHLNAGDAKVSLDFTRSTIQHLRKHSPLLWVHTICMFVFSMIYFRYVSRCRQHVQWSWKHGVIGARSVDMWDASVFVKDCFPEYLTETETKRLLELLYPGQVSNVTIIVDNSEASRIEQRVYQIEQDLKTLRKFASLSKVRNHPQAEAALRAAVATVKAAKKTKRDAEALTGGSRSRTPSPSPHARRGRPTNKIKVEDLESGLDVSTPHSSPRSSTTSLTQRSWGSAHRGGPECHNFSIDDYPDHENDDEIDSLEENANLLINPAGVFTNSPTIRGYDLVADLERELLELRRLGQTLQARHAGRCLVTFSSSELAFAFSDPVEREKAISRAIESKIRMDAPGSEKPSKRLTRRGIRKTSSTPDMAVLEQASQPHLKRPYETRRNSAVDVITMAESLEAEFENSKIREWDVVPSPDPHDLIWESLHLDPRVYWLRTVLANLLIGLVLIVLTMPATTTSLLSHIGKSSSSSNDDVLSIENWWMEQMESMIEHYPELGGFIFVFIPQLFLVIVNDALMVVVSSLGQWEPHHTYSSQEISSLVKMFYFLLLNTLFIPALAFKSLESFVGSLVSKDASPFALLGQVFVVTSGAFTLTYIITQTWVGAAFQLVDFTEILQSCVMQSRFVRPWANNNGSSRILRDKSSTFEFGTEYATFLSVLVLVVVFSMSVPIILPFGIIYFFVKLCVDEYQLNYVHGREKSHAVPRCRIGRAAVRYLPIPILLFQIGTIGYFSSYVCVSNEILPVAAGRHPRGCTVVSDSDSSMAVPGTQVIRGTVLQLLLLFALFIYTASDALYVYMVDTYNDEGMVVGAGFADQPFVTEEQFRRRAKFLFDPELLGSTEDGSTPQPTDLSYAAFLVSLWESIRPREWSLRRTFSFGSMSRSTHDPVQPSERLNNHDMVFQQTESARLDENETRAINGGVSPQDASMSADFQKNGLREDFTLSVDPASSNSLVPNDTLHSSYVPKEIDQEEDDIDDTARLLP